MKKALLLASVLFWVVLALAETVSLGGGDNAITVLSSSDTETVLQYTVSKFEKVPVRIEGAEWFHVYLPKEGITQEKGFPQLPVFNRSIIIDNYARMKLEIYDVQYQDIELAIAPSKGIITRDIDPANVPYTFDNIYQGKDFYPAQIAELSEPYILRDFRGITVKTVPFAYNPQTKTLRVYTSYKIRVFTDGMDTRNVLSTNRTVVSREFAPIYENHFVNWNTYRYTPVSDTFGKLLVICHTNYMSTILPYVNWKKQKGILTELIQWSTIGTTAAELQTYIQTRYNADNTIAYIQIVGDAPQIPTLSSGGGGSDPTFSLVAGGDNYPDIFIGRFSAESTADVTAQINKAIVYERDLTTTATWLNNAMGIASAEGGGSQGDNGESDIAHMNLIRTDLLGYGYTTVDQVYDPGASAATVTTNVNAGRGFINYVGHGSNTTWVTTGFSNTNASALTNGNKTPFIMDVACVNGNFVSITCFAEAWLRNANGGAVAMYASTINQSWNSPMRAQDECTDLLIAESKTTAGGLYYNSSCEMMDIYGNTTGSDGVNMFKTWTIFGDASLVVRSKTPIAMSVTHPSNIVSGTTSVNVSTGVNNTLVAITHNNTIYGRGFTNSSGNATITLTSPPVGVVTYTITATAFNRVTYVGTINQTVASGPWMEVTAANYDDANNDTPEYNESGYLDVTFLNSGTSAATNVSCILTCTTTGITITDNTHTISSLANGSSTVADNAYAFSIANNLANGTVANFTITMTMSGYDPWIYNFSKTVYAPALAFGSLSVSDPGPGGNGNGILDPGETVTVTIPLNNTGGAASPSGSCTLSCANSDITVNNSPQSFGIIAAAGNANLSFSLTAASGMSQGTLIDLVFSATAGAYNAGTTKPVEVGAPLVLTIGNGTSSQTYPLDRYYNRSSHEAIYLASELDGACDIKSIGFYKASGADVNPIENVTIYMKNTTASTLSSGTYSLSGYTQVYSGSFPNAATSGWMEVDLNPMFEFDGVSNLSILTIKGFQQFIYDYPNWTYTTSGTYRARQAHSDDTEQQPTSLTASYNQPNLKLKYFPISGLLYPPRNLAATATHGSVTLTWQAPVSGSPTGYKIYKNSAALTTVSGLTYTDTAVTDGTTYSYYVTALYGADESDPTSTVNATPNMHAPTNLTAVGGNTIVNLSWTAASGREAETAAAPDRESGGRVISGYKVYRDGSPVTTVAGTAYQDTGLTNGTTYSYYVTTVYASPAGESSASNTAIATPNVVTEVVIGSGTSSNGTSIACPINVYYESLHGQAVYTAAELNAEGVNGPVIIAQLGFNVTGLPTLAMPNYVIRMKHTTASDVASWVDNTNLVTVWSSASYLPTSTGWNMLTLSTPFTWNGTDNILIDTAFGDIGSWTQSGTTQYTSVTNGYHFTRSDTEDQTNVFVDGSTYSYGPTDYRPNVKLTLQPAVSGPYIVVNPTSVDETVYAGGNATPTVTIQNTGTTTLNWSTSASFASWGTVTPTSGSIAAGGNAVLTLTLNSTGLAVGTYTDEVVIASNATNNTSLSVPVSFTVESVPVPSDIRFIAEWEPAVGSIICYDGGFGLPYALLADLSTRGTLYVVVTSGSQSTANSLLSSNGVTMGNVQYINPSGVDTYWTRDYGPWSIFDADGELAIVDFKYNRPRPYDDSLNALLDDELELGYYYLPLVATGGNVMTDGNGKMMSTSLILSENDGVQTAQVTEYDYTQAEIEDLVFDYLGVTEYQFYSDPLTTSSIDHIDCWGKLLDVDKVMIARVPVGHSNYAALEAVVDEWEAQTSSYGTPYQVFRVDQSSNNEPYTNAFIFNNKIYVPQWNSTPSSYDTAAIAAYQAAMPGYTVAGYYDSSWLDDDALHCRINTIHDEQMLHVRHAPPASALANSTVTINAEISHRNALAGAETYVAYKHTAGGSWLTIPLSLAARDAWTAQVPTPAYGQTLYYYILATDITDRSATLPLCGSNDPFELLVNQQSGNTPPTITLPASFSFNENGSLVVDFSAYVDDEDDDPLTLSYSGNTEVQVSIDGLVVTFTAAPDWYGTENLTFTVDDGTDDASDNVDVVVNQVLAPPVIFVDYTSMYANLQVETQGTDSFTITNNGEQALTYTIGIEDLAARTGKEIQAAGSGRSIAGSTLTLDTAEYEPGTTLDWTFTVTNNSTDTEWLEDIYVTFPAGVTVNSATNFTIAGQTRYLAPDQTSGSGITINWYDAAGGTYGVIYDGETATATVNVTISSGFSGDLTLPYQIDGDIWGSEPHTLSGSIVLSEAIPPVDWCSALPLSGTIPAGQSETVTVHFSAVGKPAGTYQAQLTINSNDPVTPALGVGLLMEVWEQSNTPPTITLPESFSFDMNGSLAVDFSPYVDDEETEDSGLTLSYSGNTSVQVEVDGMEVTFTAAAGWFGAEELTFTVDDGTDDASDQANVIVNLNWLAVPEVSISQLDAETVRVSWTEVANALSYQVWASDAPYSGFILLGTTAALYWDDSTLGLPYQFYRVIATDTPLAAKQ